MRGDGDELLDAEDPVDHLAHRGLGHHLGAAQHALRDIADSTGAGTGTAHVP